MAAVTRPRRDLGGKPLLHTQEAHWQAEELMQQFDVIYPDEQVLATALHGASTYGLAWFDAHLWAYAEVHGLPEILSEDFEHGRHYGSVRAVDPFLSAAGRVDELPAMYAEDEDARARSSVPGAVGAPHGALTRRRRFAVVAASACSERRSRRTETTERWSNNLRPKSRHSRRHRRQSAAG